MHPERRKSGPAKRYRGFKRTSDLLQDQIRTAGESRGFAVSRLLTHWAEIVGPETAAWAVPAKVSYSHGGIGATLTILTTGSMAPILQAESPKIRDKVNACYGYSAISRIRITQTAPTGFSEGQVAFNPAPPAAKKRPKTDAPPAVAKLTRKIGDSQLRKALEELGQNISTKPKSKEGI